MAAMFSNTLRPLKRIIATVLLLILFLLTWAAIMTSLLGMRYDDQKKKVGNTVAKNFPVLILTPTGGAHKPWILYYSELAQFKHDHPEHSFLIPENEQSDLSQEVSRWGRDDANQPAAQARFQGPTFHVENQKPEYQLIQVDARVKGDKDPNVGWYEATAKGVTPLCHQSYNRNAVAIEALIIGFLANSTFWCVVIYANLASRKRRQAKLAKKEERPRTA